MPATLIAYVTRVSSTWARRLGPTHSGDAELDEVLQPAEVAFPNRSQCRLGDERARPSPHPPREHQLLGPREPGTAARAAAQREPAASLDDAAVLDAHGASGLPLGDGQAVVRLERTDAGEAVEAGAEP